MGRKFSRVLICFFLSLTLIAAVMPDRQPVYAATQTKTQVDKILAKGRKLVGSQKYNHLCQKFVRLCYEAGGSYSSYAATSALQAWKKWRVSSSRNNIPVGATVYFTSGSIYGHVGIYTGDGKMLHALETVREEPISNYGWGKYLGWGYQGGKAPTGCYIEGKTIKKATVKVSSVKRSDKGVTLTWKGLSYADGYQIYRKLETGKWKCIKTIKKNATVTYTDTSEKAAGAGSYRIRAYESTEDGKVFSKYSETKKVAAADAEDISITSWQLKTESSPIWQLLQREEQ